MGSYAIHLGRSALRALGPIALVTLSVSPLAAWAGSSKAFIPPETNRSQVHKTLPQGHLYVLDAGALAVDRYPLAPDGLPATKPDGVLNLEGVQEPQGLAVDELGNMFIADQGAQENTGAVYEFAAGSSGPQTPIASLNLQNNGPNFLKIDRAGRLYVHYGGGDQNQSIAIFAKGASGSAAPISVIQPYYKPELASDYVITRSGALYILAWSQSNGVIGYDDPLDSPSTPNIFMWPQKPAEFYFSYALAFDEANDSVYIQFATRSEEPWGKVNFGVRPLSDASGALDRFIFSGQCGTRSGDNRIVNAVIFKSYLLAGCQPDSDVIVFRKNRFGRRHAIELIGRGTILGIAEIAIGP